MYDLLVWWYQFILWSFGTLANFVNEQRNNVHIIYGRLNEVQKLDIGLSLEAVFVHKMIAYTTSYATTSLV